MKITVEVVATPFIYFIVDRLKAAEDVEFYDRQTDFSPFACRGRMPEGDHPSASGFRVTGLIALPVRNNTSPADKFFATMVWFPMSDPWGARSGAFCAFWKSGPSPSHPQPLVAL